MTDQPIGPSTRRVLEVAAALADTIPDESRQRTHRRIRSLGHSLLRVADKMDANAPDAMGELSSEDISILLHLVEGYHTAMELAALARSADAGGN